MISISVRQRASVHHHPWGGLRYQLTNLKEPLPLCRRQVLPNLCTPRDDTLSQFHVPGNLCLFLLPIATSSRSDCDSDAEEESARHFARFRQFSVESNQQQQSTSSFLLKAVSKRKPAKAADPHHPKFQQIAGFSQMALSLFWGVLVFMGDCSGLFKQIQCSEFASHHTSRILSGYATNTVLRYLAAWSHFVANLEGLGLCFGNLDSVMMADILVTMSLEKHGDPTLGSSCCMTIKALRWLCKVAECTILSCAYEKVIGSFLKSKIPRERRESFPLPTWVLQLWERRILMKQASLLEVVVLGGFLVAAWGSLRFADLQRVEWSSLSFDLHVLRGTCYATKTCHTGQPWGILASGILSRGTHSWVSCMPLTGLFQCMFETTQNRGFHRSYFQQCKAKASCSPCKL